jgi:hypothetical protein
MGSDLFGDSSEVEIGDVDGGGEGNGAGTHAAIATDAHVDLKAHFIPGKRYKIGAVLDAWHQ